MTESSLLSFVCEPFFAELCLIRSETPPPAAPVAAARVLAALDAAGEKAGQSREDGEAFRRIRRDLIFFADYALSRPLPGWRSIAEERLGIVTGEELLCHDCEDALEEGRAGEAAVFRICAGLGFSGAEAVGAERWRRTEEALFRLSGVSRPEDAEAANPAPAPSRSGPVRRTPWLILLFAALAAALAGLTVWQIARAPATYRARMGVLREAAASSDAGLPAGGTGASRREDGRRPPAVPRSIPGSRNLPGVPRVPSAPRIPGGIPAI